MHLFFHLNYRGACSGYCNALELGKRKGKPFCMPVRVTEDQTEFEFVLHSRFTCLHHFLWGPTAWMQSDNLRGVRAEVKGETKQGWGPDKEMQLVGSCLQEVWFLVTACWKISCGKRKGYLFKKEEKKRECDNITNIIFGSGIRKRNEMFGFPQMDRSAAQNQRF